MSLFSSHIQQKFKDVKKKAVEPLSVLNIIIYRFEQV